MDGENTFMKIRVFGEPKKKEAIKPLKFNKLIAQNVRPWGLLEWYHKASTGIIRYCYSTYYTFYNINKFLILS